LIVEGPFDKKLGNGPFILSEEGGKWSGKSTRAKKKGNGRPQPGSLENAYIGKPYVSWELLRGLKRNAAPGKREPKNLARQNKKRKEREMRSRLARQ